MINGFTYEPENTTSLETYEWDRTWWEHTEDTVTPRALYIGDSISWDIRTVANRLLGGEMLLDGYATSKALDNPFFSKTLALMKAQMHHCELILLNNGLHGAHMDDKTYEQGYRAMLEQLKAMFPGVTVAVVLTTHVENETRDARMVQRNGIASAIAMEYGYPVVDLYSLSASLSDPFKDGVHFKKEANECLAAHFTQRIREIRQEP